MEEGASSARRGAPASRGVAAAAQDDAKIAAKKREKSGKREIRRVTPRD